MEWKAVLMEQGYCAATINSMLAAVNKFFACMGFKTYKVRYLRHLFARTFYRVSRDVVKLANVLGHTSMETTRVYLMTTGKEYARQLNRLGLVL